jgi:hypothetical protein
MKQGPPCMEMGSLEENETGSAILRSVQQRRHQSTNATLALACQFCNVIVRWGEHKIVNIGCKDSVGCGACSRKLPWQKYLAAVKIFGGHQNFTKILGRQKFVRDSMAGQNYSPHLHTEVPIWKRAGRLKKTHMGTPHYQKDFVPIRL